MRACTHISLIALAFLGLAVVGCSNKETAQAPAEQVAPADAKQVDVALGEWYIKFNPAQPQPGQVQFNIRNEGKAPHALAIEGEGVKVRSQDLDSGQSTTMAANLPAGTYRAWCPIGSHAEHGMDIKLVVESAR